MEDSELAHNKSVLTVGQVKEIRQIHAEIRRLRAKLKTFGVSAPAISNIANRVFYKDID